MKNDAQPSSRIFTETQKIITFPTIFHSGNTFEEVAREMTDAYPEQAFCFLNEERLRERARVFQQYFLPEDPRRLIAYAVKANSRRRILEIFSEEGISAFDCASLQEIRAVLEVNQEAEILFNHPIKKPGDIQNASALEVCHFTVQDEKEVQKILENQSSLAIPGEIEIAVRLITWNEQAKINLSEKFGATSGEVQKIIQYIRSCPNIRAGIYAHTGSQNESPHTYITAIKAMAEIAKKEGSLSIFNIGGGLPVNYFETDRFNLQEYLEIISNALRENASNIIAPDGKLIIEPGRAMVAEAIDLLVPVQKKLSGRLYFDDGLYTSFSDAAVHKWKYNFKVFTQDRRNLSATESLYTLFGRTCDCGDVVGAARLPNDLKEGDYIHVPNAGAYMDSQTSYFNGFEPPWYVIYNSRSSLMRGIEPLGISQNPQVAPKLENHEYTPHIKDNPKVQIRRTPECGRGVFAREKIEKDEIIAIFNGPVYRADKNSELPNDPPDYIRDHTIQIGEKEHLHGKNGLAELLNHSCEPNCGIKDDGTIVAMREIKPGEELTWDYAMTEDSDWYLEGCKCGSANCRGKIGPYRELPDDLKLKYKEYTARWLQGKYKNYLGNLENVSKKFKIETLTSDSPELTPEKIRQIVDFFIWIFANDFSGQFIFYPSVGKPISAQEVFGLPKNDYVSLDAIKSFDIRNYPLHPRTGECAMYWVDPEVAFERFQKKFKKDAHIALLRGEADKILGFCFGRKCTLREAFETEEWKNPHYYSKVQDSKFFRDFDTFLSSLSSVIAQNSDKFQSILHNQVVGADLEVYVWNCFALAPEIRGVGQSRKIVNEFFKIVPPEMKERLIEIGEPLYGSVSYQMFKSAGALDVTGVLKEEGELVPGDPLLIIGLLSEFAHEFSK